MIFFSFGFTSLGIERKHEFGMAHFPKFTRINLLIVKLTILSKQQDRSLSELIHNYAYSELDLDWHPYVRRARRLAEAKGRAQGQAQFKDQNKWLMREAKELQKKYQASEQENRELRQTIKGMKLVGYIEELERIDDGETPTVIIEASKQ